MPSSIPSIFAVVGGRPLPLFQGALPEPQVRAFLDELLKVAAANGVAGSLNAAPVGEALGDAEPAEDPGLAAAYDAIESGDWPAARAAYKSILGSSPNDAVARRDGFSGSPT